MSDANNADEMDVKSEFRRVQDGDWVRAPSE